jgi:hypothetical protein
MSESAEAFLNKFFFWGLCGVISASAALQWQTYKEQNAMRQEMTQRFIEIANIYKSHDARIASLEREISEAKGQMVGWDTLKRIELFLNAVPQQQRGNALANALRSEIETSKSKK